MIWECHYCGEAVESDEGGYNFFMDKYYCDPSCAKNDGIDMSLEYNEYGEPIKE